MNLGFCQKILRDHTNRVRSAVLSPDGKLLASGSDDQTVRLRKSHTGECLSILSGHNDRIWSVAFSPDGQTLATGSTDQTIRLWEINSGHCLKFLPGHSSGSGLSFLVLMDLPSPAPVKIGPFVCGM